MTEIHRPQIELLGAKRRALEGDVTAFFTSSSQTSEVTRETWTKSPILRDNITRAVTLVLAADTREDLEFLMQAQLNANKISGLTNAGSISNAAIPESTALFSIYDRTMKKVYTQQERTMGHNQVDRPMEIALAKRTQRELQEFIDSHTGTRREIAVRLAQLNFLLSGQLLNPNLNLNAEMYVYKMLTSEAVIAIAKKLKEREAPADPPPGTKEQRSVVDRVLDSLDEVLQEFDEE